MSDKFKKTVAVSPSFVDGEASPAAKFTVLGSQIRVAAEQLEKAIGDGSDQSWPYHASITKRLSPPYGRHRTTGAALGGERFTGIANLARLIGPAANLNPRALVGTSTIVDTMDSGVHEFPLSHPPDDVTAVTFSGAGFSYVANPTQLNAANQYSVTRFPAKIYFSTATSGTSANRLVTYDVTPSGISGSQNYSGASFNVIPDPNQTQTGPTDSVTVTGPDAQGVYDVVLPTGGVVAQQSNIKGTSVTLGATDINGDLIAELPEVLSTYTAGDPIPNGFVVLRDNDLNAVYPDATYEYVDQSNFRISGVSLTIANEFSVLTVGTDITSSIDDLRVKQRHNHDGTFGEPGVPVSAITGILEDPGSSGAFVPSTNPSNFAPQYLHRDGYVLGEDDTNLNDANIMRGHLVLGSQSQPAGSKNSLTGASYVLRFGSSGGPGIYKTALHNLTIDGDSEDVHITTGALCPQSTSGYAGEVTGDVEVAGLGIDDTATFVTPRVASYTGTVQIDATGGLSIPLDFLTTFDAKTVVSFTCLLETATASNIFVQPRTTARVGGGGANFDFSISYEGGSVFRIYIPAATNFPVTNEECEIRLMVWYI